MILGISWGPHSILQSTEFETCNLVIKNSERHKLPEHNDDTEREKAHTSRGTVYAR